MKVLLTGSSGFLGQCVQQTLASNYELVTLGRSNNASIQVDLSKDIPQLPSIKKVIHIAGKAHIIPKTEEEKEDFFAVNFQGTKNLCEALLPNISDLETFVFISTVAVYGLEEGKMINEETPLAAESPYGRSKVLAEQYLIDWGQTHNVDILILRLPLIFDFNAPGNLGKMIGQIKKGSFIKLKGALGKKSIVSSEDIASHMPSFLNQKGIYNLTDGYHPTMNEIAEVLIKKYNAKRIISLPKWVVTMMARVGDFLGESFPLNTNGLNKLTSNLTFDDRKAQKNLHWKATRIIDL